MNFSCLARKMSLLNKAYERKSEIPLPSKLQALPVSQATPSTVSPVKMAAAESSTPTWRRLSLDVSSRSLWMIFAMCTLCPSALWASGFNRCLVERLPPSPSALKGKCFFESTALWSHPESFQNVPVPRPHAQRSWLTRFRMGPK